MLFLYVPNEAVFKVHEQAEHCFNNFAEIPEVNEELSFTFPEITHPLNTRLSKFFQNGPGFFHYDASILYEKNPFQLISSDRFPALHNLVLRVEAFERLNQLENEWEESDSEIVEMSNHFGEDVRKD